MKDLRLACGSDSSGDQDEIGLESDEVIGPITISVERNTVVEPVDGFVLGRVPVDVCELVFQRKFCEVILEATIIPVGQGDAPLECWFQ